MTIRSVRPARRLLPIRWAISRHIRARASAAAVARRQDRRWRRRRPAVADLCGGGLPGYLEAQAYHEALGQFLPVDPAGVECGGYVEVHISEQRRADARVLFLGARQVLAVTEADARDPEAPAVVTGTRGQPLVLVSDRVGGAVGITGQVKRPASVGRKQRCLQFELPVHGIGPVPAEPLQQLFIPYRHGYVGKTEIRLVDVPELGSQLVIPRDPQYTQVYTRPNVGFEVCIPDLVEQLLRIGDVTEAHGVAGQPHAVQMGLCATEKSPGATRPERTSVAHRQCRQLGCLRQQQAVILEREADVAEFVDGQAYLVADREDPRARGHVRLEPVVDGGPCLFRRKLYIVHQPECASGTRPVHMQGPRAAEAFVLEYDRHVGSHPGLAVTLGADQRERRRLGRGLSRDALQFRLYIRVEQVPDLPEINAVVRLVSRQLAGAAYVLVRIALRESLRELIIEIPEFLDVPVFDARRDGGGRAGLRPVALASAVGGGRRRVRRRGQRPHAVSDVAKREIGAGRLIHLLGHGAGAHEQHRQDEHQRDAPT